MRLIARCFILGPVLTALLLAVQDVLAAQFWYSYGSPNFYFKSRGDAESAFVLAAVCGFFVGLVPMLVLVVVDQCWFRLRSTFLPAKVSLLLWIPLAALLIRMEFQTEKLQFELSLALAIAFALGPSLVLGFIRRKIPPPLPPRRDGDETIQRA